MAISSRFTEPLGGRTIDPRTGESILPADFTPEQVARARLVEEAWRRWRRGRDPVGLVLADMFPVRAVVRWREEDPAAYEAWKVASPGEFIRVARLEDAA